MEPPPWPPPWTPFPLKSHLDCVLVIRTSCSDWPWFRTSKDLGKKTQLADLEIREDLTNYMATPLYVLIILVSLGLMILMRVRAWSLMRCWGPTWHLGLFLRRHCSACSSHSCWYQSFYSLFYHTHMVSLLAAFCTVISVLNVVAETSNVLENGPSIPLAKWGVTHSAAKGFLNRKLII
ncbi:hypothetical protein Scep_026000 [Stephania cephalantha]|uniref:Uncharacterized protein n=1 Tax=Stephania cephalantha TaxID=152367 RepID=A0AAP0HS32_9MAGN